MYFVARPDDLDGAAAVEINIRAYDASDKHRTRVTRDLRSALESEHAFVDIVVWLQVFDPQVTECVVMVVADLDARRVRVRDFHPWEKGDILL